MSCDDLVLLGVVDAVPIIMCQTVREQDQCDDPAWLALCRYTCQGCTVKSPTLAPTTLAPTTLAPTVQPATSSPGTAVGPEASCTVLSDISDQCFEMIAGPEGQPLICSDVAFVTVAVLCPYTCCAIILTTLTTTTTPTAHPTRLPRRFRSTVALVGDRPTTHLVRIDQVTSTMPVLSTEIDQVAQGQDGSSVMGSSPVGIALIVIITMLTILVVAQMILRAFRSKKEAHVQYVPPLPALDIYGDSLLPRDSRCESQGDSTGSCYTEADHRRLGPIDEDNAEVFKGSSHDRGMEWEAVMGPSQFLDMKQATYGAEVDHQHYVRVPGPNEGRPARTSATPATPTAMEQATRGAGHHPRVPSPKKGGRTGQTAAPAMLPPSRSNVRSAADHMPQDIGRHAGTHSPQLSSATRPEAASGGGSLPARLATASISSSSVNSVELTAMRADVAELQHQVDYEKAAKAQRDKNDTDKEGAEGLDVELTAMQHAKIAELLHRVDLKNASQAQKERMRSNEKDNKGAEGVDVELTAMHASVTELQHQADFENAAQSQREHDDKNNEGPERVDRSQRTTYYGSNCYAAVLEPFGPMERLYSASQASENDGNGCHVGDDDGGNSLNRLLVATHSEVADSLAEYILTEPSNVSEPSQSTGSSPVQQRLAQVRTSDA